MTETRRSIELEFAYKRRRALEDAEARRTALYKACPALGQLDAEMAALSYAKLTGASEAEDYERKMQALIDRKAELAAGWDIEPHFACEICRDTGRTAHGDCKCFINRLIEKNLASANLSVSSRHETFERFDLRYYDREIDPACGASPYEVMRKTKNVCERFAAEFDKPERSLLLSGKAGLGKTFLSSAIARRVLAGGYTVLYISAAEFAARANANKFGEQSAEMQIFYDVDLLILDDLGTEFKTSVTVSAFGDILDRRLRMGKKMVFSTNLNMNELETFYGARVTSRLAGFFAYLPVIGRDIRLQKREEV